MNFVIIGYGFVGRAVEYALSRNHNTSVIDPALDRHSGMSIGSGVEDIQNIQNIDGFVICVPTPQGDNGRCDDSLVLDYVYEIIEHHPHAHILIKSTTSVPTLSKFRDFHRVTFSPEFLRGSVGADPTAEFMNMDFAIYGGKGGRWWHEVFSQIIPTSEVRYLDIESAGFLKYVENSFLATKVMFFNEIRNLFDNAIGSNYDAMIEALALDERIGYSHTQVPGPDGEFGFGGHCLPKDTAEMVLYADDREAPLELLAKARELNEKYRGE